MSDTTFLSRLAAAARRMLADPRTGGLDLDDPHTTAMRRRIIAGKPFLREIYQEWYAALAAAMPAGREPVLELGSGAGFLDQFILNLIRSDMLACPGIDMVLDGQRLPFDDASLRGIAMTNVLHHLPRVREFFAEAGRCVRVGGALAMVEPWVTGWSQFVYGRLHHEPFDPAAAEWEFASAGPLSGANGALPWMVFARDRARFEREFPYWQVEIIRPMMPVRYLLSGGVSLRAIAPGWSFGAWKSLEKEFGKRGAMFALIVLRRVATPPDSSV